MVISDVAYQVTAAESNLKTFDELDFEVFNNQNWEKLSKSHARDIVVTWPDGHQTRGIEKHVEDLKAMFSFAPNTKITAHDISFGVDEWTCVKGVMTGTFSQPMQAEGKTVEPTGKSFKINMVTVARWAGGKMTEELLMWDNYAFMKQIGLL